MVAPHFLQTLTMSCTALCLSSAPAHASTERVDKLAGFSFKYSKSLALTEITPVGAFDSLMGATVRYVIHKKGLRFVAGDDPAKSVAIITSNPGKGLSSLKKSFAKERRAGTVDDYRTATIGGKRAVVFISKPTAAEMRQGRPASWMLAWAIPYTPPKRPMRGALCQLASISMFFRTEVKTVKEAKAKLTTNQRRILASFLVRRARGKAPDPCSR